jgi:GlpG protein
VRTGIEAKSNALRVFFPTGRIEVGNLTLALILASVAATLLTDFSHDEAVFQHLTITRFHTGNAAGIVWKSGLPEICHGEVWRLVTPGFVHVSLSHLIVNMLWLMILGTLVEVNQGTLKLLGWFLLFLVGSGLCQYLIRGPSFAGSSGVTFGLLAFIWVRNAFDAEAGLKLDKLVLALGLCYAVVTGAGLTTRLGQAAHIGGFLIGMGAGAVSGLLARCRAVKADAGR